MRISDWSSDVCSSDLPVANRVEGNKRPLSSMSPTIVYGPDGKVILALGSAGGKRIIMHVAKTLVGVLDWGLSAKDAIALPNLFFDTRGAIIEDDAMGLTLARESAVFGKDRKRTRLNSSHSCASRMTSAACQTRNNNTTIN